MTCLRVNLCEDTREQGVVQWPFRECEVKGHCTDSLATDVNIQKDRLDEFAAEKFCVKRHLARLQLNRDICLIIIIISLYLKRII